MAAIRILVDPNDPRMLRKVNALQDAVKVDSRAARQIRNANWDPASRKKVGDALTVLGATFLTRRGAAGRKDEVDPVRHLIVTAAGWGANPERTQCISTSAPQERR